MALDKMQGLELALNAPSHRWLPITPNDSTDLVEVPKFLMVGATGGTLTCRGRDNVDATFQVAAGGRLDVRPHRILATGTTATPIIACY